MIVNILQAGKTVLLQYQTLLLMIPSIHPENTHPEILPLSAEARRKYILQQFNQSGARFDPGPAWRCFERHNDGGHLDRFREEYLTVIRLMTEWGFPQLVFKLMMSGLPLGQSLQQAQAELDGRACKRALRMATRVQTKRRSVTTHASAPTLDVNRA